MPWRVSDSPAKFEEALAWFRARTPMPPERFYALQVHARDKAFTVSHVAQMDVVQQVLDAVDRAIENGTDLRTFSKETADGLRRAWLGTVANPGHRIETIFRTNTGSAFCRGRDLQLDAPAVKAIRPYHLFDAIRDAGTSEVCKEADGTILPADHPWWETHSPLLHHQCRSHKRALRRSQIERLGGVTRKPTTLKADEGFGVKPTLASTLTTKLRPDYSKYDQALAAKAKKKETKKRPKPPSKPAPGAPAPKPRPVKPAPVPRRIPGAPKKPKWEPWKPDPATLEEAIGRLDARDPDKLRVEKHAPVNDPRFNKRMQELSETLRKRPPVESAIYDYTSNDYGDIRAVERAKRGTPLPGDEKTLRAMTPTYRRRVEEKAERLAEAHRRAASVQRPHEGHTLYRGARLKGEWLSKILSNREVSFGGSGSTSFSFEEAAGFAAMSLKGRENWAVVYEIKSHKTGIAVDWLSANKGEQEVLFSPDSRFRITKVERFKGERRAVLIQVEEV